ncbi:MAG: lysoplasmalogenase [Anaerolineales bacterium]|jgi:uncharacterized membrane protein YhhN
MNANLLLILVFVAAVADWAAVAKGWKKTEYIAKPATMLLLFVWLVVLSHLRGVLMWFGLGVLFSLVGDVFLMISDRWFLAGLVAFLLAQVMYIVGLNLPLPDVSPVVSIGLALLLGVSSARVLRRITGGLAAKGLGRLVVPVLVSGMIITVMLLSAMLTLFRGDWKSTPSLVVSTGAILFYFSDLLLAWDRFVTPVRNGRLINMVLYHLGQIALIFGAVLQFGK